MKPKEVQTCQRPGIQTRWWQLRAKTKLASFVVGVAILAGSGFALARPSKPIKVTFPNEYRSWTHVKSMWLSKKHGLATPFAGLHHIYGNERAEKAMKSGASFPDGSVIVFDLLEGEVHDEAIVEGKRAFIGVMERNHVAFPQTGGWGFEVFAKGKRNKRAVKDGGVSCFQCHISQKNNDYVFTSWRP